MENWAKKGSLLCLWSILNYSMLLTFLFAHFSHHLFLQFWDFHSLYGYLGTHVHRINVHTQNVTHQCTHAYASTYHIHIDIHTHLSVSPSPSSLPPTSNNSSAYKTKWHLWIIAQCPLWMALQVLTMHIHICYKKM